MCITFFYIDRNPDAKIKFVMVHNREEDFSRPTSALGQFEDDKNIFGGRDQREQGTWFAFNAKTQNLAFLTNRFSWGVFRDRIISKFKFFGKKDEVKTISRGKLIQEFVSSDFKERYQIQDDENQTYKYGQTIFGQRHRFMPFNLLAANLKEMEFVFLGNHDRFPPVSLREGYHTFCNYSSFEAPIQKQNVGLNRFKDAVELAKSSISEDPNNSKLQTETQKNLTENIHQLMENQQKHFSLFFLPMMNESSVYIKPYYSYLFSHYRGTRTSTVLVYDNQNNLTISENTYYQDLNKLKTNIQMNIQL